MTKGSEERQLLNSGSIDEAFIAWSNRQDDDDDGSSKWDEEELNQET